MKNKPTSIEDRIKKLNAEYLKASPEQRRVLIAKDALDQIKAGKFEPKIGVWTEVTDEVGSEPAYCAPLQPVLHQRDVHCQCCGVGAIFLSYVRLANKATYGDGDGYGYILATTGWPASNLRLIELAFEQGDGCIQACNENESDAAAFAEGEEDETARLKLILSNIIKNDGTFKP